MLYPLPSIIQGGMGVGVSDWTLARAVSRTGQLGVVSGTALATVLVRRLQLGDPNGIIREALDAFPRPDMVAEILKRYFITGGKSSAASFRATPLPNLGHRLVAQLTMVANFVEVHLAKRHHNGLIGINLLEKIQTPTLASLYGAMLAGVDCVFMGAGIPRSIPGVLDAFAANQSASLRIDVQGAQRDDSFVDHFDPAAFDFAGVTLERPAFLGIVASNALAKTLAKRASGSVEGLVVEGPTAGGHNAPPRGPLQLSESGEPVFGNRDFPDLEQIRDLGLPFWLAGAYGRPGRLAEARALGATGIQVGTPFAFCEEFGLTDDVKADAIQRSRDGLTHVFTDPVASPTGFPFKVLGAAGSLSETPVYEARERICDLGYLRTAYRRDDGSIGYRCPGEPVEDYLRKGGKIEDTVGRKCVCNGLLGAVGLAQNRQGEPEPTLLTAGEDAARIAEFLMPGRDTYSAAEVIHALLQPRTS
jgi:NAD(P)H-dependent flavin oxidoreductase YrpB (nitropropane dioxygenase family)